MLYDIFMAPLEYLSLRKTRKYIARYANGSTLEIGFGTGANVKFYPASIDLIALDRKFNNSVRRKYPNINYIIGNAESIPLEDESVDTVIATLTLCSVSDMNKVLHEIYRVLKPGGTYLFMEHILPKNKLLKTLFNSINPTWKKISGGCQLNHQTDIILSQSMFTIQEHHKKNASIVLYGVAKKRT